jgi:hypothetical protein
MADWWVDAGPYEASEAELTTLVVAKLIKLSVHDTNSLPPSPSLGARAFSHKTNHIALRVR